MSPVYLGDGVYVAIEHGMARLTTGSHQEAEADNVIFLEPDVIGALQLFLKRWREEAKAAKELEAAIGTVPDNEPAKPSLELGNSGGHGDK